MPNLPSKSVDLIVTDPPYNIKKAVWDKWKRKEDYIAWMGEVLKECERLLKDNGSLYFFHNDFLQMVELQNWINKNTDFVFKQMIVWNKRFEGASNKGFLDGFVEVGGLRNYQQMAEYILYYTFQDETGLTTVKLDTNNFPTLRRYFKDFQEALGMSIPLIENIIYHSSNEGDIAFDPFAGSFTTSIACLNTNRNYICIEKEKQYCDIGRRRIEQWHKEQEGLREGSLF